MIFFHPVNGPDVADLAALELRRGEDADIAELIQVIRKLTDGAELHHAKQLRDLKDSVDEAEAERDEALDDLEKANSEKARLRTRLDRIQDAMVRIQDAVGE